MSGCARSSRGLHVLCLPAFGSFDDVELDLLSFLQAAKPGCLNCREMYKDIFAILAADESIAFRVIEPLHCSCFHLRTSFCSSDFPDSRLGCRQDDYCRYCVQRTASSGQLTYRPGS